MARTLLLVLIAACEFQPAPPAPPPSPAGAMPAAPKTVVVADAAPAPTPTPVAVVVDASVTADATAVTAECLATGAHIADVLIAGTTDTSLKASYEQARDRIVRTAGEACTTQGWTADAQRCFMQTKQQADLEACEKKFPTRGR